MVGGLEGAKSSKLNREMPNLGRLARNGDDEPRVADITGPMLGRRHIRIGFGQKHQDESSQPTMSARELGVEVKRASLRYRHEPSTKGADGTRLNGVPSGDDRARVELTRE